MTMSTHCNIVRHRMAVVVVSADIGSTPTEVAGRERGRGDESQAYMYICLHLQYTMVTRNSSLHTLL